MKIFTLLGAGLLLSLSTSVFAEEHADEALKHTNAAVTHGKAGHASVLVEHADEALKHAQKSAEVSKGDAKNHIDEGIKSLESAIEHGKQGHAEIATEAAEEAVKHIKAGNK